MTLINMNGGHGGTSQQRQQRNTARFESGWDKAFGKKVRCDRCGEPHPASDKLSICDDCDDFMCNQMMEEEAQEDAMRHAQRVYDAEIDEQDARNQRI